MEKIIYLLVAVKLESNNELSKSDLEYIVQEMDFNFSTDEDGVNIQDTEIKELFHKYPDF